MLGLQILFSELSSQKYFSFIFLDDYFIFLLPEGMWCSASF
jgi:hypothetical protein